MQTVSLRKFLGLGASVCLLMSNGAWAASEVLDYTIRWSTVDERYHVYMKPAETPSVDRSMTGQVTIVVPHASGAEKFQVDGLSSTVDGVTWSQNSRTNAPTENTNADYLSFTFTSTRSDAFGWQAGEELEVFNFTNSKACLNSVSLLNNDTDPFIIPVNAGGENSAQTNPGNQFSNLGWTELVGDNNYRANYGDLADCRYSLDPDDDGLITGDEIALGSDPDNPDSDGDGLPDGLEAGPNPLNPVNTDGDDKPNLLDPDDDGDGVLTKNEAYDGKLPQTQDSDGDGQWDYLDADDDNDGILTKNENYNGGTPEDDDTDNDKTPDYLDTDDDGDGVLTQHENYNGGTPEDDDTDDDKTPDYLDTDDDGDGELTKDEVLDPTEDGDPDDAVDSDGDSIPDYRDPVNDLAAIQVRVMLQGAFDGTTNMMADDLRSASLIPVNQPYNDAVFGYDGAETASAAVMQVTGDDAVVDWVLVELRDKTDNASVVARRAALVQRDGDVVDSITGSKTLQLAGVAPDDYYVSIRHRNHLGVMASDLVRVLFTPPLVDFSSISTAVYGDDARTTYQSTALLWAGNADSNNKLIANGPGQDSAILIGQVLLDAGNASLSNNYILKGYRNADLSMDGNTIVAGPGNDLNLLSVNILLHPGNSTMSANFIIPERLP